jgi:branched-chain amino acid transport system ATP-binding protein
MLFEATEIRAGYGGKDVIRRADLRLDAGDALLIRGGNGSGKSTLLRALSGQTAQVQGQITFRGKRVGCKPFGRAYLYRDSYLVPQSRNVFDELTVRENLIIASRGRASRLVPSTPDVIARLLSEDDRVRAGLMSGGQKKVLAIVMGIASGAPLLFLDEPLAGLSNGHGLGAAVVDLLCAVQREGRTLVIVEHREAELVKAIESNARIRVTDIQRDGTVTA